ncbi:hypothetical protein CPC08DRAFT_649272 [Agrocybe pediades]|nr:hypothetical protein CPC08DRAFT_649272 [Agrocybe pediades]
MRWIISLSPTASSMRVLAFASPSFHRSCSFFSSAVGTFGSADSGYAPSFSTYFSSPRSRSTASIRRFHGIQLLAFSNSIRYDPDPAVVA